MRVLTLAILAACMSQAAGAADLDPGPLRGTQYDPGYTPIMNWEGGYFGGFAGSSHSRSFDYELADTVVSGILSLGEYTFSTPDLRLPRSDATAREASFGAFAGYNFQLDEIVFGIEADYTRTRLRSTSQSDIADGITVAGGPVVLYGRAETEIGDFGTLRVRAGYTYGSFLPFVTGGLALGETTIRSSVSVLNQSLQVVQAETSEKSVALGAALGAGVDVALSQNIFLRGEYQYVFFDDLEKHTLNTQSLRAAAGVKF